MKKGLFAYLPISLFSSVMGLSAMCVAWSLFANIYNQNIYGVWISSIFGILTIVAFVSLMVAYTLKIATNIQNVKNEFANPMLKVFFGTFCIAILLLSLVLYTLPIPSFLEGFVKNLAFILWIVGVICMLGFSVYIASFWICHKHELSSITPAWIIPVVGLLDIPLFLPYLETRELALFDLAKLCIAVGLFFAMILIPLILARIIFFEKLPDKLTPTLLILLAPFGIGFNAYIVAFGIDEFAKMLFFVGIFLFFTLLPQIFSAYKCCPFRVSWWAISFPLAALSIAALKIAQNFGESSIYQDSITLVFYNAFAILLLCFVTLAFIWLIYRTISGIFKGELEKLT